MNKRSLIALILVVCLALTLFPVGLAQELPETTSEDTAALAEDSPAATQAPGEEAGVSLEYAQKELGQRVVTVTAQDLTELAAADTVKLSFTMSYNGKVTRSYEAEKAASELTEESPSFEVTLPFFGKWQVVASCWKDGQQVAASAAADVALGVTECNIINMYATTDMLIESIKLTAGKETMEAKGMAGLDESIPTVVAVCRQKQYNWDALPENLYPVPLVTDEQVRGGMNYSEHLDAMSQYVAELYEINPDTVFHFYINDVHLYVFPKLCYKNQIPADHYTLTLVTDGSGSYVAFRDAYTNETVYSYTGAQSAAELHEKYVEMYLAFRQGVMDGKSEEYLAQYMGGKQYYWVATPHYEQMRISHYVYAILDAEDQAGCLGTQWWVVRRSTDTFGLREEDAEFQARVLSDPRISNNYINNCLTALESAGNTAAFKELYHFDSTAFQDARDEGKKPLMILGTSASIESQLPPLDYIGMMQEFYGDEYAFFYKGHPGNYAMDNEANQKPYVDVGVYVLESSIAAELFDFYNPDLYCAGYSSSFFQNISGERNLALWNYTQEQAAVDPNTSSYADTMEFFISEVTGSGSATTFNGTGAEYENPQRLRDGILKLLTEEEKGDRVYLVQFQNTADHEVAPYDNAVWNAGKGTLRYLTEEDGALVFAPSGETPGPQPSETPSAQPSTTPTTTPTTTPNRRPSSGGSITAAIPSPSPSASAAPSESPAPAPSSPVELAPGESVEVKLAPVADATDAAPTFEDIQGHWAKDTIVAIARKGILQGTGNGFRPDDPLDRAQLATVLFRLSEGKAVQVTGRYWDVADSAWYRDAVNWASVAGVVNGVGNGAFDPQGNVTREQLAVMLYRYAKAAGLSADQTGDLSGFRDASAVSDWAAEGVAWCVGQGLLQGHPDGTLDPQGVTTRAQAAVVLDRFIPKG